LAGATGSLLSLLELSVSGLCGELSTVTLCFTSAAGVRAISRLVTSFILMSVAAAKYPSKWAEI
jgi:hypothetical protein